MARTQEVSHPGRYIRKEVLPVKLSVTKAAEILGVGRPALSNLLNGNAALSPDMALRIEKAFGEKSEKLLRMQAAFDEQQSRQREKVIAVRTYAPGFLDITAAQIAAWADRGEARSLLAAFLRRLVRTTGANLTKMDFPAFDNAQRPGWDGQVETDTATPWIPGGRSGWEFGCNQEPRQKAQEDYVARTTGTTPTERRVTTFVFVTPRNWAGKDEWAREKKAENNWNDVRALDASDLEQWLEQSVPAQSWLAERLGVAAEGILSLDECWDQWAKVTKPELSKELFHGSIETHRKQLTEWLDQPPTRPFIITADSKEEGLAFVACALDAIGEYSGRFYDRAVALCLVEALRKATRVSSDFIAVIPSTEVEASSAGLHNKQHTIIIRGRNAVEGEANIALDLLDNKTFKDGLVAMGIKEEEFPRWERESGQCRTILRRRLSAVPAIKFPPWAEDKTLARKLIPLGLVGVWHTDTKADQDILEFLSGTPSFKNVEEAVTELRNSDQPPVWSVGKYRGVASKIDVLYATQRHFTPENLTRFFFTAKYVLSEEDPALELPEDDRAFANLYGKTRNHSAALREGICETLVLLAVHGNNLFSEVLGINVEAEVNVVIRDLLTPFRAQTWESHQHDLPRYAEAAPDLFLDIVRKDLESETPQILSLLRPAGSGVFGGCPRSGLLWALEALAWRPERLLPVACILARLSGHEIEDNWVNKPVNSLASMFRSWMPQTAASVDDRCAALETLARKFPKVGWQLCMGQFETYSSVGTYSARPRWRNDASGAGQPVTQGEDWKFRRKALDIALARPTHDEQTLGDLVERLQLMPGKDQEKVWSLVDAWTLSCSDEELRAYLRERIRRFAFTRRGHKRGLTEQTRNQAKRAYHALAPHDSVIRHHWLFAKQWVDESLEELDDVEFNFKKRDERIARLRSEALQEIWAQKGYSGILRLCLNGEGSYVIGRHLAGDILQGDEAVPFLHKLASEGAERAVDNCIAGVLGRLPDAERDALIAALMARCDQEGAASERKRIRVLCAAPFIKTTWAHVDRLPETLRTSYWREVSPHWAHHTREELHELIEKLTAVDRPRAAFDTIHLELSEIGTRTLIQLLHDIVSKSSEAGGQSRLDSHYIAEALKVLSGRPDASRDELAQLEFIYLTALDHSEHGIPNLERQLAESPALFMQAIGLTYKRDDDGDDPPEWLLGGGSTESVATQAYRLLHAAKRIPGTREDGSIDADKLKEWIVKVRALCKTYARSIVGDHVIGELLAKSQVGADGIWPCEPVRAALEEVGTKEIADGMAIGLYNLRGATWRGEGGAQERELAAKYRGWSRQLAFDSPFVSRLLDSIARKYDRDAEWHDTDASIRKRLLY